MTFAPYCMASARLLSVLRLSTMITSIESTFWVLIDGRQFLNIASELRVGITIEIVTDRYSRLSKSAQSLRKHVGSISRFQSFDTQCLVYSCFLLRNVR